MSFMVLLPPELNDNRPAFTVSKTDLRLRYV